MLRSCAPRNDRAKTNFRFLACQSTWRGALRRAWRRIGRGFVKAQIKARGRKFMQKCSRSLYGCALARLRRAALQCFGGKGKPKGGWREIKTILHQKAILLPQQLSCGATRLSRAWAGGSRAGSGGLAKGQLRGGRSAAPSGPEVPPTRGFWFCPLFPSTTNLEILSTLLGRIVLSRLVHFAPSRLMSPSPSLGAR